MNIDINQELTSSDALAQQEKHPFLYNLIIDFVQGKTADRFFTGKRAGIRTILQIPIRMLVSWLDVLAERAPLL